VLLIGVALAIGALIGLALPPSERRFKRPRARLLPLVGSGVLLQVVAGRLDDGIAVLIALVGFACLLAFTTANMHLIGMGVLTVGLAANVLVIAVNGGMPVRPRALVAADVAAHLVRRRRRQDSMSIASPVQD
jgi:hypothetical protein